MAGHDDGGVRSPGAPNALEAGPSASHDDSETGDRPYGPVTAVLHRVLGWLEGASMAAAAAVVLAMAVMTAISVAGRELIGLPIPDDIVIQGIMMVAIIILPLAFVQAKGGHIAVTVATDWLPARGITLLKLIGTLIGLVLFAAIGWEAGKQVPGDFESGGYYDGVYEIPVWPPKVVFVVGIAVFVLRLALSAVLRTIELVRPNGPAKTGGGAGALTETG